MLVVLYEDIVSIIQNIPYTKLLDGEKDNVYFVLLHKPPVNEVVQGVKGIIVENEKFVITKKCVYLTCAMGYGKAKCNNNFFEKKLKVTATTRNLKTMKKLMSLAEA